MKKIAASDFPIFEWQTIKPSPVIGVDEVGRGCLAGRVYAAAVILNFSSDKYTDSKLISEIQREKTFSEIISSHKVGIGYATVEEIDKLNILQASLLAMRRAVLELKISQGHLLVDGTFKVPNLKGFAQTTLIKGDLRAQPIGAASIVAKVTRDRYMCELANQYPQYDFEKHKGYSTQAHKRKIAEHGPTIQHRTTFKGVREYVQGLEQTALFNRADL